MKAPQTRRLIMVEIMSQLRRVWQERPESCDRILFCAAASMCFFGFLRLGEVTIPTNGFFDPVWHLAWGDEGRRQLRPKVVDSAD